MDRAQSELPGRLPWISEIAHQRMQAFVGREMIGQCDLSLTSREHEVLSWTADGKTSWEISQILGISQSTVNFHINRVLAKLNTPNKLQAAVKAVSLGILGYRSSC